MYGDSLYGQVVYGNDDTGEINPDEHFIDLMQYLPDYYQGVKEVIELQTILGYSAGALSYGRQDTFAQCFIATATWGLERWEKLYGLKTDKSKSFESRREILRAKLRGASTTTKEMIKNVAIAFSGGEVAIQEYPQEYRFVVQFIGTKGIPQNMSGLINAIDEIKPAHLAFGFKYTYTVWQQISMTWQEASLKTWGDLRIYEGE